MTSQPLSHELAIYDRLKEAWASANEGKFALIHKDDEPSIWDTYNDALKIGYDRYGLDPFLVKQIRGVEQVQFITRNVVPCHS
jgi:hypothetical protein